MAVGVELGVGAVDAVDARVGALAEQLGPDLGRPQRRRGVGGEERVAHAGGEDDDAALLEVADGPAPDVGLGHLGHVQRAQHPGGLALLLEGVLEGQGVDHRAQHAHGVGGGAVHAAARPGGAAPDVAAADHDGQLEAAALLARAISLAMRSTVAASMVSSEAAEARASPDILRTMRRGSPTIRCAQAPMTTCANETMRAEPSMPAIVCFSSRT